MDYIDTVANILRHYDVPPPLQASPDDVIPWETASFITHVAYLEGAEVPVDEAAIQVGDDRLEGDADADSSGTGHLRCAHPAACAQHGARSGPGVLGEDSGVGNGAGSSDIVEYRVHTCMDNGQWSRYLGARASLSLGRRRGRGPADLHRNLFPSCSMSCCNHPLRHSSTSMDAIRLPIQPTGAQLSEHVAALDLLAARLDALAARRAWPALVPFNSKASFPGSIINTNSVKIATGPDSWAEMPPSHAAEYVRRRKNGKLRGAVSS